MSQIPKQSLSWSWITRMAWRDSRKNRSRLLLFISSIILGIAALVSIFSLGETLRREIDLQAASLIGADLVLTTNRAPAPMVEKLVDSLGGRRSNQKSFTSMALFPRNGGTRLVQVRALDGEFPYYGKLESTPDNAGMLFRKKHAALVDKSLMLQFNLKAGDTVKLGTLFFPIEGSLVSAPGQTGLSSAVAPVIYIPLEDLPATGLEQKGSRITFAWFYKFDDKRDMAKLSQYLEDRLDRENMDINTVESQKESSARSFRDVTRFLSLVGFIALLLGCIGVASAIHIYVREKIQAIAILRCLGASARQAFLIYLLQILVIGLLGSLIGALLGTIIQQFLPILLKDLLPVEVHAEISWKAVLQGIGMGLVISLLFALVPLLSIRKISPLNTLRTAEDVKAGRDPLTWLVYAGILGFIYLFTGMQLGDWQASIWFTLGVILAFLLLSALARLLMWAVRKFFPENWAYVWRQGLSNLYRPHNQTAILILSIGLGTALICTVIFIQKILLDRVTMSASNNQSNMVLFDIQAGQRQGVLELAQREGLPAMGTVPIVNMRLESVNRITAETLKNDTTIDMGSWIFSREYRVTFRDSLINSEKLKAGEWQGSYDAKSGPIYVSVEERMATRNSIKIGDTMTWNVQGAMIPTIVGSYREVDWNRIQTNFLVVFPKGVLEDAPQFHVLMTRVPDVATSARFQQEVVKAFPNVSIIDLNLVLSILDDILGKIGFVIRFMALFCLTTGLVVLIASVLISKYQRMRESVLLRTLGASRRQIFSITALEYVFLGTLAAFAGIVLSLLGSWALAYYVFETPFRPAMLSILLVFMSVVGLTVLIGIANSRFIVNKAPLEVLREEG
ncbi:MAG: ABC transporter permease [Chitinophagaceae bacterium]|nr:ABC transporter permease [Chitinophagaceae bacterium]